MGRVLTFIYGIFALSATARATFQILTKFSEARLAYLLSLAAGIIYILATIGLALGPRGRTLALVCVSIELVGVLAVGTASFVDSQAFPHATVWSHFGQGYGYVPLVLPIIGMIYLLRMARAKQRAGDAA
jgi:uncharacterized membrane protein YkgB